MSMGITKSAFSTSLKLECTSVSSRSSTSVFLPASSGSIAGRLGGPKCGGARGCDLDASASGKRPNASIGPSTCRPKPKLSTAAW